MQELSVLALSSRFDGRKKRLFAYAPGLDFQYSLCRVVLMVGNDLWGLLPHELFQYSLCRVVLMVVAF